MSSNDGKSSNKNPNIIVTVRVRPPSSSEHMHKEGSLAVKCMDERVVIFDPADLNKPQQRGPQGVRRGKDIQFGFDRVFDQFATQYEVFQHTTQQLVNEVLNGYNCACFAYGATGAGKTFTMVGNKEAPGVMVLTLQELFSSMKATQEDKKYIVKISYLEVYNENIHDLLVPQSKSLSLLESGDTMTVLGLTQHEPQSAEEVLLLLQEGNARRAQNFTHANAESSRSHAVLQVIVEQRDRTANVTTGVRTAKFSLIDLAGSERASKTKNQGKQLTEGANINRSLLALGNCINALGAGYTEGKYVPYRDSKLTRLLKDSLGGNCKTVMISNVSPSTLSYEDTFNTLQYANRAKNIKTKVRANELNLVVHVSEYKDIIADLRREIDDWKKKCARYETQVEDEGRARQHAEETGLANLGTNLNASHSTQRNHSSGPQMLTRTVSMGLATPRNSKTDRKLLKYAAEVEDVVVDRKNTQTNLGSVDAAIREAYSQRQTRLNQINNPFNPKCLPSNDELSTLSTISTISSPSTNATIPQSPSNSPAAISSPTTATPEGRTTPRHIRYLRRDIEMLSRKMDENLTLRATLLQRLARNAESTKRLQLELANLMVHAEDASLLRQLKLELSINSLSIMNLHSQLKETHLAQNLEQANEKRLKSVEVVQLLRNTLYELGYEEPEEIAFKCNSLEICIGTMNDHMQVEMPSPFHSKSPRNDLHQADQNLPPSTPSRLNFGASFNPSKSPTVNYSAKQQISANLVKPLPLNNASLNTINSSSRTLSHKPPAQTPSHHNGVRVTSTNKNHMNINASAKKPSQVPASHSAARSAIRQPVASNATTIPAKSSGFASLTRGTVSSTQRGGATGSTTSATGAAPGPLKKPAPAQRPLTTVATKPSSIPAAPASILTNKPFQGSSSNSQLVTPTKVSHKYRDQLMDATVEKAMAAFKPTFAPKEKPSTPGSAQTPQRTPALSTPVSSSSSAGRPNYVPNPLAALMSNTASANTAFSTASSYSALDPFATLASTGSSSFMSNILSRPPTAGGLRSPTSPSAAISSSPLLSLMSSNAFTSPVSPLRKPMRI